MAVRDGFAGLMCDGTETGHGMTDIQKLTTGEAFGRLYTDLVKNGLPCEVAGEIVLRAASDEIRDSGYFISNESKESVDA